MINAARNGLFRDVKNGMNRPMESQAGNRMDMDCRYMLATGTRVREEDFGLLFFSYTGPRLYFISCGDWLGCEFFESNITLGQWLSRHPKGQSLPDRQLSGLIKSLNQLKEKGVIVEF
jgi:hypothetical protein